MADSISLDWLAFTFVGLEDALEIQHMLEIVKAGLGDFEEEELGFNGYHCSGRFYSTGRIGWTPDSPSMGVHISFPSGALGNIALERGWSPFDLLGRVFAMVNNLRFRVQVTRLDVALDDTSGGLDWDVIRRSCSLKSALVTIFRRVWSPRVDLLKERESRTIYFGERASDTFLRIYDKAEQQGLETHWLRVEIEVKHKRADMLARLCYSAESFLPAVQYIKKYLDFKSPRPGDSNPRRWPTADWWFRFLSVSDELSLKMPKPSVSVERMAGWLARQAAVAFACLNAASRSLNVDIFDLLIRYGEDKLKPVHMAAVKDFSNLSTETLVSTGGDVEESAHQLLEWLFPDLPPSMRVNYLQSVFGGT